MKDYHQNNSSSQFLKTDGGKTKSNAIEVPSISLPKGGGAIKGIDEKFSVNAVNGTASFSIPLPFSPARGASPSLSLSYNSGSGNGIFGLGWNLGLASIKRKADKGLPQYKDATDPYAVDSDTFLFSEAEDLVPEFEMVTSATGEISFIPNPNGNGEYRIHEKNSSNNFKIRYYKPRNEGLFARIERWHNNTTGETKWRVITKDNVTTLFGWTGNARLCDPANPDRIYEWLPEFIFDDKGNCSQYLYKKEDDENFDSSFLHNRNRLSNGSITYTNLYLEKTLYGNKTPYKKFGDAFPVETDYMFQTVFDYGVALPNDSSEKINDWDFRADAFSDYKAGFEIRTTRLCKRVLLFHVFDELAVKTDKTDRKTLVKSANFEYDTSTQRDFTFLRSITSYGYIKRADGTYSRKNLPPTEFTYQGHEWNKEVKVIDADALIHAPSGLSGQYQFTDLFNEGLSGILTEQANGWYYKHNLGNGKFAQAKLVTPKPSFTGLGGQLQLTDLDADGGKQFVSLGTEPKGYFELNDENEWQPFHNFENLPNVNFGDAHARMLDLNGDGKSEMLISEDNVFTWYPSEGRQGFAEASRTSKPFDEEKGAHVAFADQEQTIFLADMSGDGLTDIVRIRNGEVCYWPNLGYGKFGAKVAMDNAPVFDHPGSFNPSYLRLADIDGSGTTDIIYLGQNRFTCWTNLSGNAFSTTPFEIEAFPELHDAAEITVTDLLGNGVSCIVWSSSLAVDAQAPLRYMDLMSSKKPHIMVSYKNNLGKEVHLEYAPSTKFYMEDKLAGKPWITKLHFPVHCVSQTKTLDKISGHCFVSSYNYHHGYYDHGEREFRGFGMVEQIDAETFEQWKKRDASNIVEEDLHQEPVISKTWTHTGAFVGREKILNQFTHEYWYEEMNRQGFSVVHHEMLLPDAKLITAPGLDPTLVNRLSAQEWQQALRACKGMTLRSETFAHDAAKYGNTEEARKKELIPYSVASHNCVIELLQPKGQNNHAIFLVKESEAITYNYERALLHTTTAGSEELQPRIAHSLNIKLDEYGNVLESAAVVYPRLSADSSLPPEIREEQAKTVIIYTQNKFTERDIDEDHVYRLRLLAETKTFELKGVVKSNTFYTLDDFEEILADTQSETASYHEIGKALTSGKAQKRLIEHVRTIYYKNNLEEALPLYQFESLAFPFESYQLAYTPDLLADILGSNVTSTTMISGKFVHSEGDANWWIRSGQINFIDTSDPLTSTFEQAQERFFLPLSYTDPYGAVTKVKHGEYFLFIKETEDALGNTSQVDLFNFRTLSPQRMKDINDNLSETITDELGLVKAWAVRGKGSEADNLALVTEETLTLEHVTITDFFTIANAGGICDSVALEVKAKRLLQNTTTRFVYDFDTYTQRGKPAVVTSIAREQHFNENPDSPVQISFEYSNGLGKVIMKKVQAEPQVIVNPGNPVPQPLRWIGNGRTIVNNKGNAVKQYEPFFSASPKFEDEREMVETGVTPTMYYDAMSRLIKTEMPNGTFSKVEFDSWKQFVYDANDTVNDSEWYKRRTDPARTDYITDVNEQSAAVKASAHKGTPSQLHFDTLGRPVLQIEDNGKDVNHNDILFRTKIELDVEGNLRKVTDAREISENSNRGNIVMRYKYDMLGNMVYQNSMDAGERWMVINVLGQPLKTWDARGHIYEFKYDALHRVSEKIAAGILGTSNTSFTIERTTYGEGLSNAKTKNLRGQVYQHYDSAGLTQTERVDFKGNVLEVRKTLTNQYDAMAIDWSVNPLSKLENEEFIKTTEYDALNRMVTMHNWHSPQTLGGVYTPKYNERGLLVRESLVVGNQIREAIRSITYDEKGQRLSQQLGCFTTTQYNYDRETFRLVKLITSPPGGGSNFLQHLLYTYDPVGNIMQIEDKAYEPVFFNNQMVEAKSTFTYDALYRLTEATGRENSTLNQPPGQHDNQLTGGTFPLSDPNALRNYTQKYQYDQVGNILEMRHLAGNGSQTLRWTRNYVYETNSNRLKNTFTANNPATQISYAHDVHGNIKNLGPTPDELAWNYNDMIQTANLSGGGVASYNYGGDKQRSRKRIVKGAITDDRIYLEGFEIFRRWQGTTILENIETHHLFSGSERVLMVENVRTTNNNNLSTGLLYRYQYSNHLGSVGLELNDNAQIISYEEYHPYGTPAYQAKSATINCTAKRYRYTGMERDEETGLAYHSARYYLPWLGRWLSTDPIGVAGGLGLYVYACCNPLNLVDLVGTQATPSENSPPADGGTRRVNIDLSGLIPSTFAPLPDLSGLRNSSPGPDLPEVRRVEKDVTLTDLDQSNEKYWVKQWDPVNHLDYNCIAASRVMLMKAEGLVKPETSLGEIVEKTRKVSGDDKNPLGRIDPDGFNTAMKKMESDPGDGSKKVLVPMNLERAKKHMESGHMIMSYVDQSPYGERKHVVVIYYNPESKQYMVLDPLMKKESHNPEPIDITSIRPDDYGRKISGEKNTGKQEVPRFWGFESRKPASNKKK